MKIYKIEHSKKIFYDVFIGHIIAANSEDEVREIAKGTSADEGKDAWDTAKVTECGECTLEQKEPFILLSNYRRG